jgi:hypothetical protein
LVVEIDQAGRTILRGTIVALTAAAAMFLDLLVTPAMETLDA